MDRNFYDNDFEEFLKQKSDQYKMYPSDRVWNNVYSSLHGRKKWWALGLSLFFIGMGLLVGRHVLIADYNRIATQLNKEPLNLLSTAASANYTPAININTRAHASASAVKSAAIIQQASAVTIAEGLTGTTTTRLATTATVPGTKTAQPAAATTVETDLVIENTVLEERTEGLEQKKTTAVPKSLKQLAASEQATAKLKQNKQAVPAATITTAPVNYRNEAVAKLLKPSRWSLQVYASPTVSYRRLSNYDQQAVNHVPVSATYAGDVNRYVNHRPAPGFELGTNLQYKLSDNLSVFAGAQLNYSRYYINAFKYSREKTSIELEKAFVRDTLSGYTDIRNFSGYAPEQLQNKYLQLSVPVGIEIKLLGHKKLQFRVAGSVQPTFLLTSTSYLLSSDYKNYIQSPDLARTFNVHTNFEAFISYQAAGLKWQVGPQFRSQLLSSYSNQYRVREYLTEYGIKIGVSKTLR